MHKWASLPKAHRVSSLAGLGFAILLSGAILYLNREFYHDDAYITLRYSRNLIAGLGVVWNPGEYVQGYSNFLHMILVALLGTLGVDLVRASQAVGLLAFAGLVGALLAFGLSVGKERCSTLWHLPALVFMTSAPALVWSISGLEGTLFSFLVALGCFAFATAMDSQAGHRFYAASGACLALSYLTRPDGVVFVAISFVWLAAMARKNRQAYLNIACFAGAIAIIVVPYTIWQVIYYGDFVPNTIYAKAGGLLSGRLHIGVRYVLDYAMRPPFLPLLVVASLIYASATRAWTSRLAYLALSVSAYIMFVVFVGGDHMPAFRFLLPVVALMSSMLPMALSALLDRPGRLAPAAITLAILALSSLQLTDDKLNPWAQDAAAIKGTIVGKHIADAWPEGSVVALNTAGSTPYYAGQHVYIDMLGLNDAHIARRRVEKIELPSQHVPGHLKGDGDYVLSRRPDFIIIGPAEGCSVSTPWFLSDLELGRDPRFRRDYALKQIELDHSGRPVAGDGLVFMYYQRIKNQRPAPPGRED